MALRRPCCPEVGTTSALTAFCFWPYANLSIPNPLNVCCNLALPFVGTVFHYIFLIDHADSFGTQQPEFGQAQTEGNATKDQTKITIYEQLHGVTIYFKFKYEI